MNSKPQTYTIGILAKRLNAQESDSPRPTPMEKTTKSVTIFMRNKANSKTEVRKQNTEDSEIMAKDKPNVFYNCRESSTNQVSGMQQESFLLKSPARQEINCLI